MNLQLVKIKRQNAFDYSLLSEFMKKKNGKLIFTAGIGNVGKIRDNNHNVRLNLMQKFERNFQFKSIIKSYNEAFHIKSKGEIWTPETNRDFGKLPQISKSSTMNKFYKHKTFIQNSSISFNQNISRYGKNTSSCHNINDNNKNIDDNSVDYNHYFYNTIDFCLQGNNTSSEKDKDLNLNNTIYNKSPTINYKNIISSTNKNNKLKRNISQDCIYLFGQNKIIYRKKININNKKNLFEGNSEIQKTPFIDYNNEFNPYKTKKRLRKKFEFFKDKSKEYETFSELKQDYIFKIRKMIEKNNKKIKLKNDFLPSHNSVKNIMRKNNIIKLIK